MRRVVWSDEAIDNLEAIEAYIDQFNPIAARRVGARIIAATESLAGQSERGRSVGRGQRELATIWPYLIRYRIDPEAVFIVRIRHGARRPD